MPPRLRERQKNMEQSAVREARIDLTTEEEFRANLPSDRQYRCDFGFIPAMARLIARHARIAPAFGKLVREVMWSPDGVLSRRECEMVAAVAAGAQDFHY